jgi:DNA ligase-1
MKSWKTTNVVTPLLLGCCLLHSPLDAASAADFTPPLMLANAYEANLAEFAAYWISEKYDGIRAYWDGSKLVTRNGHVIQAPGWFTAGWPSTPLDGELWAGRNGFEAATSIVRDQQPNDAEWHRMRFMVFDLPRHPAVFNERLTVLMRLLSMQSIAWLQAVPQRRVQDEAELHGEFDKVVAAGGEGLMLHRGDSYYRAERTHDLLKMKASSDAEAQVVGYTLGKGKYEGMVGALEVRTSAGLHFRLGTGLSDAQRRNPPALGSWVTYSYQSLTERGVPRFAHFVRVRELPEP